MKLRFLRRRLEEVGQLEALKRRGTHRSWIQIRTNGGFCWTENSFSGSMSRNRKQQVSWSHTCAHKRNEGGRPVASFYVVYAALKASCRTLLSDSLAPFLGIGITYDS